MPNEPVQNYANHVRHDYKLYGNGATYLAVAVLQVVAAYNGDAIVAAAGWLLFVVAVMWTLTIMRTYAVTVQNRVVRLETRLRLERVLPPELAARVKELTLPQLVGLRFASDEELPDLVRRVFAENLATADEIKRLVKVWQADHLRV